MLLCCVDPRIQAPIAAWMNRAVAESHSCSLRGLYSQFTIAGAAIGITAPAFSKAWGEAFWENFAASLEMHRIDNLIVVEHATCGGLGIACGKEIFENPGRERELHRQAAAEVQEELLRRHPAIGFQAWYIFRDSRNKFTRWESLIPGPPIG